MLLPDSPFLRVPKSERIAEDGPAFAIYDAFPVSKGHALVVPERGIATWFEATHEEQQAIMRLVERVKRVLDEKFHPDGYNVGFNAGEAAGQTVMHLHVHVIPRYRGDMDDPRGGVRLAVPNKGNYKRRVDTLAVGGERDPLARHLLPLFSTATDISIVAAFVQQSGLDRLETVIEAALKRGARVRILTGDYLNITQAAALEDLLDWIAFTAGEDKPSPSAHFDARVVEVERLPGRSRSFHPKAWRFEAAQLGIAFVGSSNISLSALTTGIEWNLRLDRDLDRLAWDKLTTSFEEFWDVARPLDAAWVAGYAARAAASRLPFPTGETDAEEVRAPPGRHEVQVECLTALSHSRNEGRERALVVMATGLGKTWAAAFDVLQLADEIGRRPRVLFIAHRREILIQAAKTLRSAFRDRFPGTTFGQVVGDEDALDADVVLASVSKLARPAMLERLAQQRWDYVVIDEVHHATASSYRRILDRLSCLFVLGLTATPDRADAADVLGLFDDHEAFRADVGRGISIGRLVPFEYFGVRDTINFDNVPWRNHRFDAERLASEAETEARMAELWRAWGEHPGKRSLVFCCSQRHAEFVRDWLKAHDVRVRLVLSSAESDDRETSMQELADGTIDAVCSVDIFNEGVDIPNVDRVVMLRPTESPVVYLQQLGRGLRAAEGKTRLTIIDFVGNHRLFVDRVRQLLSLVGAEARAPSFLASNDTVLELPAGCSVSIELEAKDLLRQLTRSGGADNVERAFRELVAARDGDRPTAGELFRMGFLPTRLRDSGRWPSWFSFVASEKRVDGSPLLDEDEREVVMRHLEWLQDLETTSMTKCFKMVTVDSWLEIAPELGAVTVNALAERSHARLARSPDLWTDVADAGVPHALKTDRDRATWRNYWKKNPINAWAGDGKPGKHWFRLDDDGQSFAPSFTVEPKLREAFARLTRELVDYRLARYRRRQERDAGADALSSFTCKVTWNKRDPILKLPSREAMPGLPDGEIEVRVDSGSVLRFRFAKQFCNVAHRAGDTRNALPDVLRTWFGVGAGAPGTDFHVRFERAPDGWWARREGAQILPFRPRRTVAAFPDLRAAAGAVAGNVLLSPEAEGVALPLDDVGEDTFAVRVSGSSMDGGDKPLGDGDWAVLKYSRGQPIDAVLGRVALIQHTDDDAGGRFQLKRVRRSGGRFVLASDNPSVPEFEARAETIPIATLVASFRPDDLAPSVGTMLTRDDAATAFGVAAFPISTGRVDGHLFVVSAKGDFTAPDRVRSTGIVRRPGETAFVLAPVDDGLRYCGVGRWIDDESAWSIPDLDFATWRLLGEGRETSRRLDARLTADAERLVDDLVGHVSEITADDGNRARIAGRAKRGGLRVNGGEGGFAERTVSLTDLAWVLAAAAHVAQHGGIVDGALVHRLRYLAGTPEGSTRFIDTEWAIAAWRAKTTTAA